MDLSMPNFGQELFRRTLADLINKHGGDGVRHFEEVEQKFDELSAELRLYAERSDGTFILGVDEKFRDPELTRMPFPMSYFLPSYSIVNDDPRAKECVEQFMAKASVTWQFKDFVIRFDLSKMWVYFMLLEIPTLTPRALTIGPIFAECSIKPKKAVSLLISNKTSSPNSGSTGRAGFLDLRTVFPPYEKVLPKQLRVFEGKFPTNTYFCPFGETRLQDRFTLRSTSIPVGEVFARDPVFAQILLELPGLTHFTVGVPIANVSDDYLISFMANPTATVEQIRLLHQLMTRSLTLLEKTGVIGGEGP
jgi:hypothetical protein